MTDLVSLTWPDVRRHELVLVPVGSTEQHGPHLPFDTDTVIAEAVATATADRIGGLVTPPIAFGSSGEHQSFAGTASIGTKVLREVFVELARSLQTWSGPVLFVNGHGGNLAALDGAVEQLHKEGRPVGWVACTSEDVDLHAGHTETSLMLYLKPHLVRLNRAAPGDSRPLPEILPLMVSGGVAAVSANGVLGDPTSATAEEGALILDIMVDNVIDACILLKDSFKPPETRRA
jgi:mycofactocin system creatininase family protein